MGNANAKDNPAAQGDFEQRTQNGKKLKKKGEKLKLSKEEKLAIKKEQKKAKKENKALKKKKGKGGVDEPPVVIEREIALDENDKQIQEMAAPHHPPPFGVGGDVRSSPALDSRHSPSLGLSNGTPAMNGSLMNGGRKLSGYDGSTSQYLEKHDEAHFLANLLAEERQRCTQHKDNYNTLKQEHRKLQNEMIGVQDELKLLNRDKGDVMEKHAREIGDQEAQVVALRQQISELQGMVPARDRIDALKSQMISDVEGPFRSRLQDLERDNEELRADNAKLKHDFAFLKTEYEHTLSRHKSTLDDLRLQHEAEVTNLSRDKDDLVHRLHQDNSGDIDRLHNLQKENSALNHKVKTLLTELDEVRSLREKSGLESDHVSRLQGKQMTEFQANMRALDIEKSTLRQQCDSQSRELSVLVDSQTELTRRLHEEEQRSASLRNQLDQAKHEASLQMTQSKLESVRSQGHIERERDSLHSQLDDVKCRLEAQVVVIQQLETSLREKERDCAERINAIREEEFQKLSQANHEKQSMEGRIQTLERQKVEHDDKIHRDQLRYEQQLREHNNSKTELEKEINILRCKIQNQTQIQSDLEYERTRLNDQRNQIMKLEAENSALQTSENELTELIGALRIKLSANNQELRRSKHVESSQTVTADKVLAQHKAVWSDEKQEMKKRIEELESKYVEVKNGLTKDTQEFNKKKQVYSKLVDKLRRKLEISDAEKKELVIQVESVKGYVPPEIFNKLKKELKDLKNRHREYKHIMLSGDITHQPIGDKSFASASVHNAHFDISPDHTQELPDLTSLVRRMDKLDENQQRQMADFGVKSPIDSSMSLDDVSI